MLETKRHYRVQLLDMLQGQAELSLFGANDRFRQKLNDVRKQSCFAAKVRWPISQRSAKPY